MKKMKLKNSGEFKKWRLTFHRGKALALNSEFLVCDEARATLKILQ
ncbi:MAG: hypothetical protein ABSB32_12080 [Thermodesulfobacteriota bacterium]|jgi:hypothetical protein